MANSKRKCRHCGNYDRVENMIITPSNAAFCNQDHAAKYARASVPKTRAKLEREQRKQDKLAVRKLKENDKSHQEYLTQIEFNRLVVLLDQGKNCICCNKPTIGRLVDCGHFLSVGSHPELRFCFFNASLQLRGCNRGHVKYRGREHTVRKGMEINIAERYGQCVLDWLKGPHEMPHHTCDQLKIMRAMYSAEIRYIKENGKPSRNWRSFPPKEMAA